MKTLRKNLLARVIGVGLAIGLANPAIARETPQQQSEDARHDQGHDGKAKSQHPAPQANKPATRDNGNSHRPDPRNDQSRQQATQAQARQRIQDQQRAQQQRADEQRQSREQEARRQQAVQRQAQQEQAQRKQQSREQEARRQQQAAQRHAQQEQAERKQAQWAARNYNYYSDPFYYTPASYRYQRDGRSYQVNRYAADLLQQAIRYGYQEGVRAGRADRLDNWRGDYRGNYAYQDANYGYNGYYVSRDDYNYYFRQGFRRGYEDGFGRDYRYGSYNDGNYSILASVLSMILNLQPFG
jgi:hypothetical protein